MYTDRIQTVINLVKQLKFPICAEVGVWKGELSFAIINECKINKYFMIDPLSEEDNNFQYSSKNSDFPKMMNKDRYICNMGGKTLKQQEFDLVHENILKKINNNTNINFIRKQSKSAVNHFEDDSLDFVFIDAIHLYENVKEDIRIWLPKLKSGGILSGDDFLSEFPGVIQAVKELLPGYKDSHGIWYITK